MLGRLSRLTRRSFLYGAAATALFPARTAVATTTSSGRNVDLGTPIAGAVVSPTAGYSVTPSGAPQIYYLANGQPAMFSAIDANTGERVFSQPLEGAQASWGMVTSPDGALYIGTANNGQLWKHVPGSKTVELVGSPIEGEIYVYQLDHDEDGIIYGTTYPNAHAFSYDPDSGQVRDYGTVFPGENYARSIAYAHGHIYVGTGVNSHLVKIHVGTGRKVEISLPPEYADQRHVYNLNATQGLLFVRVDPAHHMLVYDILTQEWIDDISDVRIYGDTSSNGPEDKAYFVRRPDAFVLYSYDLRTGTYASTGFEATGEARGMGWLPIDGLRGRSLVSTNFRGSAWVWSPHTGEGRQFRADVRGVPNVLRSLGTGPLGRVYVSGYLSPPGMAVADPNTGETTFLPGPSQVEGFGMHEGELWYGTYPGANIYRYDPRQPWDPGTNPVNVGAIEGQDRPFAITSAGAQVAVGTVGGGGVLNGALTLIDPASGAMRVQAGLVEDQTPITLAYLDGLIYGGTTIWGGLGVEPTTEEGHLFIVDPRDGTKVFQTVPVSGQASVSGLAFDDTGLLWGLTEGWLFRFDPRAREVVGRTKLFDTVDDSTYWAGRGLLFHDGKLVATTHNRVMEIDPATLARTIVAQGSHEQGNIGDLAIDRNGNYYYTRGTHVWRYEPTSTG